MSTNNYTASATTRSITKPTVSTTQNNRIQRHQPTETGKISTRHSSGGSFQTLKQAHKTAIKRRLKHTKQQYSTDQNTYIQYYTIMKQEKAKKTKETHIHITTTKQH
jgi:hypothetical protein